MIIRSAKYCFHLLKNTPPNTYVFQSRNCHSVVERRVPKTPDEFKKFQYDVKGHPSDSRLIRVVIVGCPNVGKSTLLNQMLNWKVSAVSSKVHTTRENVIGVYVRDNTQIEFIDTPGLVTKKHVMRHNLESSFIHDLKSSLINADVITVLVDASNKREKHKLNPGIIDLLKQNIDKESILVLNKVDKIKLKRNLLDITSNLTAGIVGGQVLSKPDPSLINFDIKHGKFDKLFERTEAYYMQYKDREDTQEDYKTGWPNFSRVFMISALHNDGVDQLRDYLLNKAQAKPWLYSGDVVTPQRPRRLIIDAIREVSLELFRQEIPYNLNFQIVMWEVDDIGNLYLVVDLYCPYKFLSYLIGPKGTTISTLVRRSRELISEIFRCDVSLKIAVKPSYNNK